MLYDSLKKNLFDWNFIQNKSLIKQNHCFNIGLKYSNLTNADYQTNT